FAIMLACFRDLGYCVEWRVINAADYGFPQKRVRIFIFAYKNNTNYYESQVNLINSIGNEKYINKGFFAKQFAISGFNDIREYILNEDILTISNGRSFQFFNSGYMIGNKIITQKYIPKIEELSTLESILEDDVDDIYYLGENLEDWKYMKGAKAIPRTSRTGHEYVFREGALSFPDILNKPARTMLTSESSKNRSTHVIRDPQTSRLRVLTPIECERLNGFPDNWTNTGMSEKFRYFCMGNALVVGLIERMGKTLSEIFENEAGERLLEILDND
ncbi:DNA (cytosine-5-)-methyltransferase, partial [Clostridium perfringens]